MHSLSLCTTFYQARCAYVCASSIFQRTLFLIFFIFIYFAININSSKKTTPVSVPCVHLWSCEDAKGLRPSVVHFKWLLLDGNHSLSLLPDMCKFKYKYVWMWPCVCAGVVVYANLCLRDDIIIEAAKVELCTFSFWQIQCLMWMCIVNTSHKKATDCFCSEISVRFTFLAHFFPRIPLFLLMLLVPFFSHSLYSFLTFFLLLLMFLFELKILSVLIIFATAAAAVVAILRKLVVNANKIQIFIMQHQIKYRDPSQAYTDFIW